MNRLRFCIKALQALEDGGEGLDVDEVAGLKEIVAWVVLDQERVTK